MRIVQAADYLAEWEAKMAAKTGGRAAELSDEELADCVAEAERRGLAVDRRKVEAGYEALLSGQANCAARYLGHALYPDGGDTIKACATARRK